MEIRDVVQHRLNRLDWSAYKLANRLHGKVTDRVVYQWLAGRSKINSVALGHILEVIGGRITFDRRPPG